MNNDLNLKVLESYVEIDNNLNDNMKKIKRKI